MSPSIEELHAADACYNLSNLEHNLVPETSVIKKGLSFAFFFKLKTTSTYLEKKYVCVCAHTHMHTCTM